MNKKVDIWRWIERGVLLLGIAGMWLNNKLDKVTWRTQVDINMQRLIESDEKRNGYWDDQLEFNGTINEFIRNSINGSRPTEEEN